MKKDLFNLDFKVTVNNAGAANPNVVLSSNCGISTTINYSNCTECNSTYTDGQNLCC